MNYISVELYKIPKGTIYTSESRKYIKSLISKFMYNQQGSRFPFASENLQNSREISIREILKFLLISHQDAKFIL